MLKTPICDAYIRITRTADHLLVYEDFFITDHYGKSIKIPLYTETAQEKEASPYLLYQVEISKKGHAKLIIQNIAIFANVTAILSMLLPPYRKDEAILSISLKEPRFSSKSHEVAIDPKGGIDAMLQEVIIPTSITVHLGRPNRDGENLTVPFLYYLKNVASSEIYPTWPREAIKANVWAQMSLALNRVFTEWYRSQGYNFDITNSTAYDQAFVKNRVIYDNVAEIVEEVFQEYIQKKNFTEPFYAEYCDGKIAQCPGMKQWGTQDLATRGYDALSILQYYYGDTIRIVSSDALQDIRPSYPGTPLQLGSVGKDVAMLQAFLNAIAINYPAIRPIFPVNGEFETATQSAVRTFQRQFNLTVDGIVGRTTWYRISFIFVAVRKLAELGSLGYLSTLYSGVWQQRVLRQGDRSVETQLMQYYLSSIRLFYPEIPEVSIDGRFGAGTYNAILAFQKRFGLTADGLVGQATWDRIYQVYTSISNQLPPTNAPLPYPGIPLQLGTSGDAVEAVQNAINILAKQYTDIPSVNVDGIFGAATRNAIRNFQSLFDLTADGIVGVKTWELLFSIAAQLQANTADTAILQHQLNMIAKYYPSVDSVPVSGVFDEATQASLTDFQTLMGLPLKEGTDALTIDVLDSCFHELSS